MNLLKPVNVLLLAAFLLYSVDTVYNAPSRSSSHACSMAELLPRRNNAEVLDDALYVAGNVLVRDILKGKSKGKELLFYEHLETVSEAAMSSELHSDGSRAAQALQEVLVGLAKDACTWTTDNTEADTEGSASEANDGGAVDCSNVTDIWRFSRLKETEFILGEVGNTAVGTEALSLALRLRPIVTGMLSYLRNMSMDLLPGSQAQRQAWVARHLSPRSRCYVCRSL